VVRENLAVEEVKVAAVAGGFPSSMTFPELKTEEARMAVLNGADEIDIVLPLWAFLEENYEYCRREIESIKKSIGDTCLKVILESGVLSEPDKIWKASILSLEAGADFIKTSTGKMPVAATPEAAVVMCRAILYFYEVTGSKRGFKAAGGITTPEEAMVYVSVVKEILGESWLEKDFFRIGASRLANQLLSAILGQKITHF
jgi:deoxyribose-phosphate aldolase